MSRVDAVGGLADRMLPQTLDLWLRIGERLLIGQEQYGDFTFHTKDLDKESADELLDYLVYRAAAKLIKEGQ